MSKKIFVALSLAFSLLLVAMIASPWIKLASIKHAYEIGDDGYIVQAMDFGAIKQGFKNDLKSFATQKDGGDAVDEVMSVIIDGFVENQVTPENAKKLLSVKNSDKKENQKLGYTSFYDNVDEFSAKVFLKDSTDTLYTIHMSRQGLVGWKITRIDISELFKTVTKMQNRK